MALKRSSFFAGLFLVCMATLMMQIIETRILSVVSMYYLAFLSISMAMLGMTVGALLVYFKLDRINPDNLSGYLSRLCTGFALAVFVCFLLQLASPLPVVETGTVVIVWLKAIILLAAPFIISGVVVSLALTRSRFPVSITYGVDLLGAATGCLAVLLLLNLIDAPSAMLAVAGLIALAGVCFRVGADRVRDDCPPDWRILRRPGLVALALLVLAGANASTRYGLQPISAKFGRVQVNTDFEFEKWNSFSQVGAYHSIVEKPALWGPSPTLPADLTAESRLLSIDGFAGTTMPRFSGDLHSVDFLKYDVTNLAYAARNHGRAAIIGVGSGRDLLSAYLFGFRDVTGVELNPIFIDWLTDPRKLRHYAGIADLPGIRFFVDEGRSWFARTPEKFDLIEMSMIDTFAATGAGAFSLSENGLYTIEGWRIFLSALKPDGVFTVSRWHSPTAPVEIGRTTSLAMAALFSLGEKTPRQNIFLASSGRLGTIIVSRHPFSAADLHALHEAADRLQFKVLASPDQIPTEPVFDDLLSATSTDDLDARAARYWLDLSPPTDSRPFFFNELRLSNLGDVRSTINEYRRFRSYYAESGLVVVGNLVAISTLFLLIALSLLAVIVTIILPARSSIHNVEPRLAIAGSTYFLLIGLGFMFIEISLIQRISVFMGHPVYALGIVLFSIILSTGIGSLLSQFLAPSRPAGILFWLALLVVYLFVLPLWLPGLMHSSVESAGLLTRALVSIAVILPAGVLMGFGFPTGMRLVMQQDPQPTPWFWGINGAAGVLAAGLAVACSIAFSIDTTIRVGAVCYLLLAPAALVLVGLPIGARRASVTPS
jgi:spermidine synthase